MATLRKCTLSKPDGTKVVTFVVDTNLSSFKTMNGGDHAHLVSDENAKSGTRKPRPKVGTYVALRISTPPNVYLVGSRDRAIEIARRAGILDEKGELTPFFKAL